MRLSFILYVGTALMTLGYIGTLLYMTHQTKAHNDKLTIVCTTSILADAVSCIVGPDANVIALMGPGIDPHTYRAREGDIARIMHADLIVYHGLHLEGRLAQLLEQLPLYIPTINATKDIPPTQLIGTGHETIYDPHVWFDVLLWTQCVTTIGHALERIDPVHASAYHDRLTNYQNRLRTLDTAIKERIRTLAPQSRMLVTAHDAFAYFSRAYGFQVISLQGINTDADINTHDVEQLAQLIHTNRIRYIFTESAISHRSLHAVQEATAMRGWQVELGSDLYTDALAHKGHPACTYIGMIEYTIDTLLTSLSIS